MAQTGLTRTAFYRHFDDVTDLVLQLLAEIGHDLYAASAERWRQHRRAPATRTARTRGSAGVVDFFVRHGPLRAGDRRGGRDRRADRARLSGLDRGVHRDDHAGHGTAASSRVSSWFATRARSPGAQPDEPGVPARTSSAASRPAIATSRWRRSRRCGYACSRRRRDATARAARPAQGGGRAVHRVPGRVAR